jgi:xylitol oxidase
MERNWAGSYEYAAPEIVTADSVEAVQRIVARGGRVHALGTRHSFTDLPDTTGSLIDVAGLAGDVSIDSDARAVRVAAGTRYGVLATALEESGFALRNMGSLPHISVAGATATGTHGSGDGNPVLSTAVRALRYVGADGEVHEVRRGDADFAAVVVGLGAFGVIVEVELDIQPTFRVRQDLYDRLTWDAFLGDVDAVTSAAYSVSVFTRWEPDDVGFVWAKTRLDSDDDPVPGTILDARRTVDRSPLGSGENITEVGTPGPWMLRLPHFRLDREPSYGEEIQSEYFVAREHAAAAISAVRELAPIVRPHLAISELRTAARDDLWLSPASGRDILAIHFTWLRHPDDVARIVPQIEQALAPFDARPHWGKTHGFDAAAIARVHPRIADARAVFERLDPDGRFANAHLMRVGAREQR